MHIRSADIRAKEENWVERCTLYATQLQGWEDIALRLPLAQSLTICSPAKTPCIMISFWKVPAPPLAFVGATDLRWEPVQVAACAWPLSCLSLPGYSQYWFEIWGARGGILPDIFCWEKMPEEVPRGLGQNPDKIQKNAVKMPGQNP